MSPRYRYDERFADLQRCLLLDGYLIEGEKLIPVDPSIVGTPPVEDDLTRELAESGLPKSAEVIQRLRDSADVLPSFNPQLQREPERRPGRTKHDPQRTALWE